jgi:hypothetical protein
MKNKPINVINPITQVPDQVVLNDKSYAPLIQETSDLLARYRLKGSFFEGSPPPREVMSHHSDAFKALEDKPWPEITAEDAPLLIELMDYLSDKEFLNALPHVVEFLLRADHWVHHVHLFLNHVRNVSKSQIHRTLPHDFDVVMARLLDALEEKYVAVFAKRQDSISYLKKTQEWTRMRLGAKKKK